jgi:hypothetical protein
MTPSPGADRWLWNGGTDLYDAYEDTDMFGPPPAPGDGVSYCMYHRLTDGECEKLKQVYSHQVGHAAFKPTHHDPIVATRVHSVPSACSWTAAGDIAVGGESVFDSSFDSFDSLGREYLSTNLSTKAHFLHQRKHHRRPRGQHVWAPT